MGGKKPDPITVPDCLHDLDSSRTALLDLIRPQIDDSMLREIAPCDVPWQTEPNLATLRPIRDEGVVPSPVGPELLEAMQGVPSSRPGPERTASAADLRQTLMHAFCSAVFLVAGADPANQGDYRFDDEHRKVCDLLQDLGVLGEQYAEALLRTLAWRMVVGPAWCGRPFFALAILLLCVRQAKFGSDPERLVTLSCWVRDEIATWHGAPSLWLHYMTYDAGQDEDIWRGLVREILVESELPHPEDVVACLRDTGRLVAGGVAAGPGQ